MTMRVLAAAFAFASLAALSGCAESDPTPNPDPVDTAQLSSELRVDRIQKGQGPKRLALPVPATAAESKQLLAANTGLASFLAGEGKGWTVSFDRRSGQPMLLEGPGIAWLPGTASGISEQSVLGLNASERSVEDKVTLMTARGESLGMGSLNAHPGMLGLDAAALALEPEWSGATDASQFLVTFRAAPAGFEQRDGRVTFVVRDGNLVQIHAERVTSTAAMSPALTMDDALAKLRTHAGMPADARVLSTQLQQVLLSTTREPAGVYTGPLGKGYEAQLAYVVRFVLSGDTKTLMAYVDARSGAVLDLFDANQYGAVTGGIWPRNSTAGTESVMPFLDTTVSNGSTLTTDLGGNYGYAGGTATSALAGANFRVSDTCGAPAGSTTTAPGNISMGTSAGSDCTFSSVGHSTRAARNAFYHLNNVRLMGKKWLDGVNATATSWFGTNVTTNVNVNQTCNAFWDGSSVNFFRSGGGCTNTGEISDVMQHEWGHGLDQNTKGGSVGDSAKGEAVADTVAILMTHDQCIGPGFFASGTGGETTTCPSAVRDLGKVVTRSNISTVCSTSASCAGALGFECHCESHLLSGSHWDLAQAYVARYGAQEGWQIFEREYLRALPNITAYIPTSSGNAYSAWLAADDDNGNTTDGTPNADLIFTAFNNHGIAGTQVARNQTTCTTRPASPTVTATGGTGNIAISWTAVSGATSYQVLRAPVSGGVAGYLPVGTSTSTSFTDSQVAPGLTYGYEVVATASGCTSPLTTAVTAAAQGGGGGDTTAPTTSITAPAAGSTLVGNVTVSANASDNVGVTNVEFYSDGALVGSSATSPYSITWNTNGVSNGSHSLTSRAYDAAGNVGTSAAVGVTVNNPGQAAWDATLRAPKCATVGVKCDTGASLVLGRANLGPEPNQPNTLASSCADGTSGTFHSDESVDQVTVTSVDGSNFAPGKQVRVDVTVWAYTGFSSDHLDIYSASDASAPAWTLVSTITPTGAGVQTLSATYTLPSGGTVQAVRAAFRYQGTASACTTGSFDDRDDVAFAVGGGTPDTTPPTVSLTSPADGSTVSGSITLAANASDNVGVSRVEFYVDGALKATDTTSPYSAGFDTNTVANGAHSVTAAAFDAAGNSATSAAANITVNNVASPELITNGGFEGSASPWTLAGTTSWTGTGSFPHSGAGYVILAGANSVTSSSAYQQITIPASATANLTFWLNVTTSETTTTTQFDKFFVEVRDTAGNLLSTVGTFSNLNGAASGVYTQRSFSLASWRGQTVRLQFRATTDSSLITTFRVDDVSVQ